MIFSKNTQKYFLILLALFLLLTPLLVFAQNSSVWDGLNAARKGLEGWLSSYSLGKAHPDAPLDPGIQEIASAFLFATDFLKYVISSIAVLYIIISAVRLISAGDTIEEVITKEKNAITYLLIGLMVVFIADVAVRELFFGEYGEFLESEDMAEMFAIRTSEEIIGMVHFAEVFVGSIAVLIIVISGFRMLVQGGDDTSVTAAKNHIIWACAGLMVIGLAEAMVQLYFPEGGSEPIDMATATEILVDLTIFVASITVILAVPALLYAGFLYLFYYGQDDYLELAKKIIKGVIIALVVALSAYAIVYSITSLSDFST